MLLARCNSQVQKVLWRDALQIAWSLIQIWGILIVFRDKWTLRFCTLGQCTTSRGGCQSSTAHRKKPFCSKLQPVGREFRKWSYKESGSWQFFKNCGNFYFQVALHTRSVCAATIFIQNFLFVEKMATSQSKSYKCTVLNKTCSSCGPFGVELVFNALVICVLQFLRFTCVFLNKMGET